MSDLREAWYRLTSARRWSATPVADAATPGGILVAPKPPSTIATPSTRSPAFNKASAIEDGWWVDR